MKPRLTTFVLLFPAVALFVAVIAWPTIALIMRCILGDTPIEGGSAFSDRQMGLLWRSLWLSSAATGACLVVALPGAYVVGGIRRLSVKPLLIAMLLAVLLCPPMVYAFAWERLLPVGIDGRVRCILVWSLWAWPIPAMLIGAGWSRVGRPAYEAALLDASGSSAFVRAVIPVLRRDVALAALVLFALFFNDYSVPHACSLLVNATELLGWAQSSSNPIDTVRPAIPSIGVTGLALVAMLWIWRSGDSKEQIDLAAGSAPGAERGIWPVMLMLAVSWATPLIALTVDLASVSVFVEALTTYGSDICWSLGIAILAGLVAAWIGIGVATSRVGLTIVLPWTILLGAFPGALVGEAMISGYNSASFSWIYDDWPVLVLCYVARFGWIGVLTALLAVDASTGVLLDQARADGATKSSLLTAIQLPIGLPTIACGACVVAVLSLADVASSSLVRVPRFSPIAHVIFEKFHRFEDGMLISLSLCLVLSTAPAVLLIALVLRRRGNT